MFVQLWQALRWKARRRVTFEVSDNDDDRKERGHRRAALPASPWQPLMFTLNVGHATPPGL